MKTRILAFIVSLFITTSVVAQVDNYCLRFTSDEGVVNLGSVNDFDSDSDWTLQFWFCPSTWQQYAPIVRCGTFSVKEGVKGALVFNDGTNHLTLTNATIGAGKWSHITVRTTSQGTEVTVNNSTAYRTANRLELPVKTKSLWLGGGYQGRIDEVRLWQCDLPTDYDSFWRNTITAFCPSYSALKGYWKMDQEQCANLVDYTAGTLNFEEVKAGHHGTLSNTGVVKEKVTDNAEFTYRLNLAYGSVNRYFDRKIDGDHYRQANRVPLIAIRTYSTGSCSLYSTNEAAQLQDGAEWKAESAGRSGVVELPTTAAYIKLPAKAFPLTAKDNSDTDFDVTKYAFETWIYVVEWAQDAFILKKESSVSKGISLRLGDEAAKAVILRVNGSEYTLRNALETGKWQHIGFSTTDETTAAKTFEFAVNGEQKYCDAADAPPTKPETKFACTSTTTVQLGTGLKCRFDEPQFWLQNRNAANMKNDMNNGVLMPGENQLVTGTWYTVMSAAYKFDKADDPSLDNWSMHGFVDHMRSYLKGARGCKFILTAGTPPSLQETMSNATKRATMAKELAKIGNDPYFDGIDIDFEWMYNASGWTNIALMCHELRSQLDESKELTVSPHAQYHAYPTSYMSDIDYFNCQQYGPQKTYPQRSTFNSSSQTMVNDGFSPSQLMLSYACTTTGGFDANGNQKVAPVGYRNAYTEGVTTSSTSEWTNPQTGWTHYFTSFDEVLYRSKYVVDNNMRGIFYWDLGNDITFDHELCLQRASTYYVAANVELLVTEVPSAAVNPADDPNAPTATSDPEDQGGMKGTAIKHVASDYYLYLAGTGNDENGNPAPVILSDTPSVITMTQSGNGFTICDDGGHWLGIGSKNWTMGNTESSVWTIEYTDEANKIFRIKGDKGYLATDALSIGAPVWRDKKEDNAYNQWQLVDLGTVGVTNVTEQKKPEFEYDLNPFIKIVNGRKLLKKQF